MVLFWKKETKHVSHNPDKYEDKNFKKIKIFSNIIFNKITTNHVHNKSNTSSDLSHPVEYRMSKVWKKSIEIMSRNTILIKAGQNLLLLVRHVFSIHIRSKTIKQKIFPINWEVLFWMMWLLNELSKRKSAKIEHKRMPWWKFKENFLLQMKINFAWA